MKIIINTINLLTGGALQRGISFINELKVVGQDNYYIFFTNYIEEQIDINKFPSNFKFYRFNYSSANIYHRYETLKKLLILEKRIKPNIIFSFVGPAYWRPKATHLVGFGIPHIIYINNEYVKKMNIYNKIIMFLKKVYTKYEADYYVVQTEDVKKKLAKRIHVKEDKIFVVSNGYGHQFSNAKIERHQHEVKRLLLISRYRKSKNFEIIPKVIDVLKKKEFPIEFHITIENKYYNKIFNGYQEYVINHGPVKASDCPYLYNCCDALFLPSFLECFSASYGEAMKMEIPILTSDYSFSRSICKDAAIYFDANNANNIAEKIIQLFSDKVLYTQLVNKERLQIRNFYNSEQQANAYINIIKKIAK